MVTTFTGGSIFPSHFRIECYSFWFMENSAAANNVAEKFLRQSRRTWVSNKKSHILFSTVKWFIWKMFFSRFHIKFQWHHVVQCFYQHSAIIHFSIFLPICTCCIALVMAYAWHWGKNKPLPFIWVPAALQALLAIYIKCMLELVELHWVLWVQYSLCFYIAK